MTSARCQAVIAVLFVSLAAASGSDKEPEVRASKSIRSGEELVTAVTQDCTRRDQSLMSCMRVKVLSYVNNLLGIQEKVEARGFADGDMDEAIGAGLSKYVASHEFRYRLPEFLFDSAILTYRPGRGLDDIQLEFPESPENEERSISEARGILKKKLLFPLLLLLKLKIKALTPLLLAIVGIKAVKALVLSKISFLLVVGFLLMQLLKKGGMNMPMAMPAVTEPPPIYGPVPTPSPYGPPAATPDTSYGPWETTNGNGGSGSGNGNGPYARWDSHNLAYSSYQPEGTVKTAQQLKQGL